MDYPFTPVTAWVLVWECSYFLIISICHAWLCCQLTGSIVYIYWPEYVLMKRNALKLRDYNITELHKPNFDTLKSDPNKHNMRKGNPHQNSPQSTYILEGGCGHASRATLFPGPPTSKSCMTP